MLDLGVDRTRRGVSVVSHFSITGVRAPIRGRSPVEEMISIPKEHHG